VLQELKENISVQIGYTDALLAIKRAKLIEFRDFRIQPEKRNNGGHHRRRIRRSEKMFVAGGETTPNYLQDPALKRDPRIDSKKNKDGNNK